MNAHVLRKRSLAKNRIFILLPVLTLLVSWCQCSSAATPSSVASLSNMMKETSDMLTYSHRFDDHTHETGINHVNLRNVPKHESSQKLTDYHNNNEHRMEQKTIHRQPNSRQIMFDRYDERTASDFIARGFLRKRNINESQNRLSLQLQMKRTKGELHRYNLHQRLRMLPKTMINNNSSIRNDSHNYRSNIIYNSSTDPDNNHKNELNAIEGQNAFDQHNTNMRRSTSTTSFGYMHSSQIFNHQHEGGEQQHHHRHKIERNRRESISKLKSANAMSRHSPFSYSRIDGQSFGNGNAARPRRFCTARDPTTLAFEAPTVFEGKVRSMSSDRRRNFSVTFEVKEIYKRQIGLKLPSLVRLKFTYKNSSECDIYRESFRPIGHVRDELEPGKLYILFVNQIDLGNFTILGQPVKLTRKTVMDVRTGVADIYGEFHSVFQSSFQRCSLTLVAHNNKTVHLMC